MAFEDLPMIREGGDFDRLFGLISGSSASVKSKALYN
jgi:hypothetical protein